ncbi:23S rRNA (adenine(2030)-N(6))-methyltransferase RlmJ [Ramlibacter sp. RBP-2]|uniref:Ribosomal RNA large subunit methyltransferase J n=1 Tax=Ramlibacter lithotrophicus TaxID=2606681 RepID=A0A7X6DGB4_9BURK|nr:23S rRNA (adenine(2030)-N(6))-methyltransferase RlmJ [Ramlibacter lithotrophicus]NKE66613.1 23S rRNA (adenine(2030)-N(6))-methyltransferase RlmJ [Ramlibacter lithotrophicus]
MFSYRHAFHAGSHADVLKHAMLIAIVRHLTQKEAALMVVDTHAGAGLYRLDSDFSGTSGEAADGVVKLFAALAPAGKARPLIAEPVPMLQDYLETIAGFNPDGQLKIYPGSPFIVQSLLRQDARDKLKLFEMHPTDSKALAANIAQLQAGRQVAVARADGFEGMKAFLPPPSRRGLVLIDPSYEIKSDYAKVSASIQDALKRFVTGTYVVWYPVIPRPEAHDLPRRLKTLANQAGKSWLHATLAIGQDEARNVPGEADRGQGLTASGMFVINPPHTLRAALQAALPQLLQVLGRGKGQGQTLEAGA